MQKSINPERMGKVTIGACSKIAARFAETRCMVCSGAEVSKTTALARPRQIYPDSGQAVCMHISPHFPSWILARYW